MKKFIALLLVMIMVLGMVACGAKTEAPKTEEPETEAPKAEEPKKEEAPKEEEKKEDAPAAPAVEKVTYFCTIGAYLDTLQAAIDEYNAGEGAAEGVYIEVTSNINDGSTANEVLMQAGTFHDISDGTNNQAWVLNGWVKDLYEVAEMDAELAELIEGYKPYFVPGLSEVNGILTSLPLEVVPVKLAVNTDLLDKYGYELPKTVDEMVEIAIGIYEQSGGESYGFGGTTWSALVRRLLFKATVNSTGTMHWDPNTGTYDFAPFKKIVEAYAKMYQAGAVLGLNDLGIDPVRAEFAAGKIAFFTAPSYDVAVYTTQFPATCNWTVIDFPTYEEGEAPYKGIYLDRVSYGICAPAFDNATPEHQKAVIEAYKFLNSDELHSKVYARAGMIPYKASIIENTELEVDIPQWAPMADITNYTSMPLNPDNLIPLEEGPYGLKYQDVMLEVIYGNITYEEAVEDLNARYNEAAQAAIEDPDINMDMYIYEWSAAK